MYGLDDPNEVDPKKNGRVSFKNRVYMIGRFCPNVTQKAYELGRSSLLDFGGAVRYRDAKGNCCNQSKALPYTTSTYPYFPRAFVNGLSQGRRDDMETLGYTLLMCSGVRVPWDGLQKHGEILKKQNELCEKLKVLVRNNHCS